MMNIRAFAHRNRNGALLLIILFLCLLLLSFQNSNITQTPERIGMGLNASIVIVLNNVKSFFTTTVGSISALRDLRTDYDDLLLQMEQSKLSFQTIETLKQENQSLRQQLDYSEELKYTHEPAKIIGKDPGVHFSSLMINKGNRHGISIGMPVVAFQDGKEGLVGKVIEISWNSALIRSLRHPENFVSARLSKTRYEGLIRGLGSDSEILIMEYLDRNSRNQISVGDEVISSGLQSLYPPNIFLGNVGAISATSYANSLELEITPFIDFTRLEYVFILLSKESEN